MELSFSPEAKDGYVHISRTEMNCKSSGFGFQLPLGPIKVGAEFAKNKCTTLEYRRP
jgi:hypothetical protein